MLASVLLQGRDRSRRVFLHEKYNRIKLEIKSFINTHDTKFVSSLTVGIVYEKLI